MTDEPAIPSPAQGRRYRGVLLDMDGTLIDSNPAHVKAWVEALREAGYEVEEKKIWPFVGMGGDNLLPAAMGIQKESAEGERISARRGEIFKARHLPHLRPFPGVRPLLERMRQEGLRLVIASSSPADELRTLLALAGVEDLVDGTTSADEAGRSKPDPDVVHAALERIGLPAPEVVLLGDTPYDVQAAAKAGVGVIALRCGGFPDKDLEGALALYDGPADLLARFDESPLGAGVLVTAPDPAQGI
jgi:HAD superfamily hydrolase (TIGR01509 family)